MESSHQPRTAREIERWLENHCKAGDMSTDLTSFANCSISKTRSAWFLSDEMRDLFAERFVYLYNNLAAGDALPCLNMIIPREGDRHWHIRPILNIEFPSDEAYAKFLEHIGKDEWSFVKDVRKEFANLLQLNDALANTDHNILFSRQPSRRHKFHLVYVGEQEVYWTKNEMSSLVGGLATFFTEQYRLEELEKSSGPMVFYALEFHSNFTDSILLGSSNRR